MAPNEAVESKADAEPIRGLRSPLMTSLTRLCLRDVSISDVAVEALSECRPPIRNLDLSFNCALTDAGIIAVARSVGGTLEVLELSGLTSLTAQAVMAISERAGAQLRELNLAGCKGVGERALQVTVNHCSALEHLNLTGCSGIPADDFYALVRKGGLPSMKRIVLSSCYQLDAATFASIAGQARTREPNGFEIFRLRDKPPGDALSSGIVPNWKPLPAAQLLKNIAKDSAKKGSSGGGKKGKKK